MARRGYEPRRTRLGPSVPAPPAPSQAELEMLLASADPDQREDAVYDLEPEGRGLEELAAIVREDPSPNVRRAAVAQAATGEGPRVSAVLIAALDDPDSDVIEEAINGLEMTDAGGAVPHLRPLLQHEDPGIRMHAEDAIAHLSE
jgi:HEAT repeat protein